MPATVVIRDVLMLATRLKRRRMARSARKRFHVRVVGGEMDVEVGVEVGVEVEEVKVVEEGEKEGVAMVGGGVRVEAVSALMGVGEGWLAATVDSARFCEIPRTNGLAGRTRDIRKASIGDVLDADVEREDAVDA